MKELWSERARSITPYVPGEQPRDRKFIKLNTNENPYPPSPKVLSALREAAGEDLRLYPDPECLSLREALAAHHGLKPEQIFVGNGSDEVLALCFQAFFTPGRTVVFPDITYSFYPVFCDLFGLNYREIPLDESFGIPVADFLGDYGGVVIANPNAPTGRELSLCAIREILEANPNAVVLVDEAYVDFGGCSAVELIGRYPNLAVVRTMSKSRSLAGLRVGYVMGSADLIDAVNCIKNSFNSYTLDRLAQAGAEAAVRDNDYFQCTVVKVMNTRSWTADRLKRMGFRVYDSKTNFLFVSHETVNAKVLLDGLREKGILVRWWNKPRISNCLRISIGTDEDMEVLCAALAELLGDAGICKDVKL